MSEIKSVSILEKGDVILVEEKMHVRFNGEEVTLVQSLKDFNEKVINPINAILLGENFLKRNAVLSSIEAIYEEAEKKSRRLQKKLCGEYVIVEITSEPMTWIRDSFEHEVTITAKKLTTLGKYSKNGHEITLRTSGSLPINPFVKKIRTMELHYV